MKKKVLTLFVVPLFISVALSSANAIEIKFSGNIRNRGTVRDLSWWDEDNGPSLYSNFWGANAFVFDVSREDQKRNNPNPLLTDRAYSPLDYFIAGDNVAREGTTGTSFPDTENTEGVASWWDTRAFLGMQAVASENLKGVFLFEFGQFDWGSRNASIGTKGESFLVDNAYVDFVVPTTPVEVIAGLAPVKLGHGVLFQDDAALLDVALDLQGVKPQVFAIKANEGSRALSKDDEDYYGMSVDVDLGDTGTAGIYGVYRHGSANASATYTALEIGYMGITGDFKLQNLMVSLEGIWEHGHFQGEASPYTGDIDVDGFLGYVDVALDIDVAKVGLAGLVASGNEKDYEASLGSDEDVGAFYSISPTDSYNKCVLDWDELFVREILANNVSNLLSPKVYLTANVTDSVSITLQHQWYWKDKDPVGDDPSTGDDNGRGSLIGKNIDVIANLRIYDQLKWRLTGSYMWTDEEGLGSSVNNIWQLRHDLTFTF